MHRDGIGRDLERRLGLFGVPHVRQAHSAGIGMYQKAGFDDALVAASAGIGIREGLRENGARRKLESLARVIGRGGSGRHPDKAILGGIVGEQWSVDVVGHYARVRFESGELAGEQAPFGQLLGIWLIQVSANIVAAACGAQKQEERGERVATTGRNAWSTSRAARRGLHRASRQEPPPGAPAPVVGSDTAVSEAREQLCGARSRLGCLKPRAAS